MKTAILHVEPFDDVASIRDKVQWCRSQRILLVLPKQSRVFPDRLDLNLIVRTAKENGAVLGIVSRSDITREFAHSLRIPVFISISQAERSEWGTDVALIQGDRDIKGKEFIHQLREKTPRVKSEKNLHPVVKIMLLMASILSLTGVLVYLVPSATVIVYPQTEKQDLTLVIRASSEFKQANITGLLPAYEEVFIVSGEKTLPSSGTVQIGGERAKGEVLIRNLTPDELLIPRGTIVAAEEPRIIRFSTLTDLTLPAGGEGLKVQVEALLAGSEGNINAGEITRLEGVEGSNVFISNPLSFAGGSSQDVNAPTELDYTNARTALLRELDTKAKELAETFTKDGKTPIHESMRLREVVKEVRLNSIGNPADTFTLQMTIEYELLSYDADQLRDLVENVMNLSLPAGYHDAKSGTEIRREGEFIEVSSDREASWTVLASREISKNLPEEELLEKIKGLSTKEAVEILNKEVVHKKTAEVTQFIRGWPWLPFLTTRITLKEEGINDW